MNCYKAEGNQGRAMVCQDLLYPNERRGAFGAAKALQVIFWKYWLSLCSASFARNLAQLSSTDTAQGL